TTLPTVTIDSVIDDVGGVTGEIMYDGTTDDRTPTLKGTVSAGSEVWVFNRDEPLGKATVVGTTWTFTTPVLPDRNGVFYASHVLTVIATDAVGNNSSAAIFPLTMRTDVFLSFSDKIYGTTDNARPTLSGDSDATIVKFYEGDNFLGQSTVSGGKWTFTPTTPLKDGEHTLRIVAIQEDLGITKSTARTFTVLTGLAAPTITSVVDNVGTITGPITNGGLTDDTTPTLNGTVVAGTKTVTVYNGTTKLGSVDVSGTTWSFTPPALLPGTYNLRVVASDAAGKTSPDANFSLTVRTSLPAPTIETVIDNFGSVTGEKSGSGQFIDDNTPTLTGKVTAGSSVIIVDGSGKIWGNATVVGTKWTFTPTSPMPDSIYKLYAIATDAAGNSSSSTPEFYLLIQSSMKAPSIDKVLDDVGTVTGSITPNGSSDDSIPTLSGTYSTLAQSTLAKVQVYDGQKLLGNATITGQTWSFTPEFPLAPGKHTLRVIATDGIGNTSPATTFSYTVTTSGLAVPALTSLLNEAGTAIASQGDFASAITSDSRTPTLRGLTVSGNLVRIFDGDVALGDATVSGGNWSFKFNTPLSEGAHILSVYSYKANGEIGSARTFTYNVKSAGTRAAPFTTDLISDVDDVTDAIVNGMTSDEHMPLIEEVSKSVSTNDNPTDIRSVGLKLEGDAEQNTLLNMNVLSTIIENDSHTKIADHRAEAESMLIDGRSLDMDVLIERLVEEKAPELDGAIEPDVEGGKPSTAALGIDDMPVQWTDSAKIISNSSNYNQPSGPLELLPEEFIQTNVM
ncbi:Ig-like domain-containing protein, partial [Pseudomonas mosselii]|uniref:Ig-like domain-containing protein n=1 Tax=Pseudomonas mosselii TaxID=78327 RepID=UPI003F37427E